MTNKCAIIVQSYEELPYLLWLINRKSSTIFKDKEFVIFSFGGKDFWQHLNNIFKNKKKTLIDLSKQNEKLLLSPKKILDQIKYYFYLKYEIKYLIRSTESLIFFTPFCVPHLGRIIPLYKKENVFYIPIPALQIKGYLDKNYKIIPKEHSLLFNRPTIAIRLVKLKFFFGKFIKLAKLGASLEPILSINFLKKLKCLKNIFSINNILEYDKYYLKHNYISDLELKINGAPSVVFFDQHYASRKIVNHKKYYQLLLKVFTIFNQFAYRCYYKGHPDSVQDKKDNFPNFVKFLPSFLPAEFVSLNNVISLSTTSGAITNNLGSKTCISLINLIPFKNSKFKNKAVEMLKRKTKVHIFCPKSLNDLNHFLEAKKNKEDISIEFKNEHFIKPFFSSL
jgi:hypothetical protein